MPTCVAWILLGDYQECWLLSLAPFHDTAYDIFNDIVNGSSVVRPVPDGTVSGRVVRRVPSTASCAPRIFLDKPIRTVNSGLIRGVSVGRWAPEECNRRCLSDPYCVAFAGDSSSDRPSCTLYSNATGGVDQQKLPSTFSQYPTSYNYWAPVQACSDVLGECFRVQQVTA